MSGRGGRGRGNQQGRGGKGRGKGGNQNKSKNKSNKSNFKSKPMFRVVDISNASKDRRIVSYQKVVESIITKLKQESATTFNGKGNEVAVAIKTEAEYEWEELALQTSTNTDEELRKKEDKCYEEVFTSQAKEQSKDKKAYEAAKRTAFSYILDNYCEKSLKDKIIAKSDYDSKIYDDPLELLKNIKELMHSAATETNVYQYATVWKALKRFYGLRQKEGQSLKSWHDEYKEVATIMSQFTGSSTLATYCGNNDKDYKELSAILTDVLADEDDRKDALDNMRIIEKATHDRLMAYGFLEASDQKRYSSLKLSLQNQFSQGDDKYPKTLDEMYDRMKIHVPIEKPAPKPPPETPPSNKTGDDNKTGKESEDDSDQDDLETSFLQDLNLKGRCYCCSAVDHKVDKCPQKDKIPRNQWWIEKVKRGMSQLAIQSARAVSNMTMEVQEDQMDDTGESATGFNNLQMLLSAITTAKETGNYDPKTDILLDTGSTFSLFSEERLVRDIKPAMRPIDFSTNAGSMTCDYEAYVPNFGKVYFERRAIANIFALCDLSKMCRVTYDSQVVDAFTAHMPSGKIVFRKNRQGLYIFRVSERYLQQMSFASAPVIDTVAESRKNFTERQYAAATRARELSYKVGFPTDENLKHLIRMNAIQNCPVTVADVTLAEKIFGPSRSALQGKSTRRKPKPVLEDTIEIPSEILSKHASIELCMDTMFVNGVGFLTSIDRSIRFRCAIPIRDKTPDEYYRALDVILRHYNRAGFKVVHIMCDREYLPLMTTVYEGLDVEMKYASAGEHTPEAERNIRTIKERVRAAFQRLPYKTIPRIMIRYLVMLCTDQLNYFPAKGGVSSYYSPRMIISQRNLNYDRDSFVQVNENTTNTPKPRMRDAIYLRKEPDSQNGHLVMSLDEKPKVLSRQRIVPMKASETVIRTVEAMARR